MWRRTPLLPFFSRVRFSGATSQISLKSNNKWSGYARFCAIQDGGGGHLESGAERHFYHFSVEYVFLVLRFNYHQNRTINSRVTQDFVKFKMAAAAILNVAQTSAFTKFQ